MGSTHTQTGGHGGPERFGPYDHTDLDGSGVIPLPIMGGAKEAVNYPTTREAWKMFPVETVRYVDGSIRGQRLLVGGNSVMEEWERPVEERTIRQIFTYISVYRPTILIGGEGLGYATAAAIAEARDRDGAVIHIVELHPEIIREGQERANALLKKMSTEQRATIKLYWHEADMKDILQDRKIFPDDSIDGARIDLYPLEPEEKDIDSFVHAEALLRIMKPTGVYAPFVGEEDLPQAKQLAFIEGRFLNKDYTYVYVTPPKDCTYFQGRRMIVMVCRTPIKDLPRAN